MTEEEKKAVEAPEMEAQSEEKEVETTSIPESDVEAEVVEMPHSDIRPGMLVRVHEKIKEANPKGEIKERIQVFEGIVLGLKSASSARTMTVRKNSKGWMVEKIFPLSSPNIDKIEVVKQYRTRRAKITFLRGKHKRKMIEVKTK